MNISLKKSLVCGKLSNEQAEELKVFVKDYKEEEKIDLNFLSDIDDEGVKKHIYYSDNKIAAYFGEVIDYIEGKAFGWAAVRSELKNTSFENEFFKDLMECAAANEKDELRIVLDEKGQDLGEKIISSGGKLKTTSYAMKMNSEEFIPTNHKNIIELREGTLEDLNAMSNIGVEAFDTEMEEEVEYNRDHIEKDKFICYVAENEGEIVGMVTVRRKDKEASIADLAVKKDMRRRGIGREILSKTIGNLLPIGVESFELGVETKNLNALELYKSVGFEIDEKYHSYRISL